MPLAVDPRSALDEGVGARRHHHRNAASVRSKALVFRMRRHSRLSL